MRQSPGVIGVGLALAVLLCAPPVIAERKSPRLYTNSEYIEDTAQSNSLDLSDQKSVLEYVLGELPPRVRVVPTENYFYFYFYEGGIKYAGNFRFDVGKRDEGHVEFVYFKDTTEWMEDEEDHHATLGAADGVIVEKLRDLAYRVSFRTRQVIFELNDLSSVEPPPQLLTESETFLGPVADESGLRFFLVFDRELKTFRYILDETTPVADELVAPRQLRHVVVGRRTGFAFYQDDARQGKTLIGVYAPNVDVNNYLDGPFDQLPDNFLKGDELRQALLAANPGLEGSIDRLGISADGETRQSISPYLEYYDLSELQPADKCAAKGDRLSVLACLNSLSR
jgi:hypothetical protein